ncbi:MAG TPA: histidine phosphatase family protein [Ktedonobacteraceae bacterium]|jgi:probable phosphoglycerate mutase|nr:histidine phosphatase family protein [Ktedonobacteraceae bacterium]
MSQEKRFLQRLAGGWIYIVWIYLSVAWRFCGWRLSLWFHRTPESNHTGMKQTLLFIRHGQTTWNVEHRLPGQLPGIDLNDTGRQQAARLSDALMVLPISAIISSPLERARETAEIIAQPRNLPVQIEPRLMDIDVGHWTGQDHDKINKEDPAWKAFVKDPTVAPPDVETFPQVQQRALEAVEYWRAEGNIGAYPAFVTHADVIKLLIAHYTGLEAGKAGRLSIDNASVSLVELEPESRPRVIAIGWNPQPGWLKPPTPEAEQSKGEAQVASEQKE